MQRLKSLTTDETRQLLSRYFDKVVSLRDQERRIRLDCSEMEVSGHRSHVIGQRIGEEDQARPGSYILW